MESLLRRPKAETSDKTTEDGKSLVLEAGMLYQDYIRLEALGRVDDELRTVAQQLLKAFKCIQ